GPYPFHRRAGRRVRAGARGYGIWTDIAASSLADVVRVRFIEDYSGNDDVMKLARATFVQRGDGGAAAVTPFNERVVPSGTRFYYASVETEVLGLVLRSATGRPVTAYLEEKIWQPMGAEADATWLVDRSGQETTFCCINAVLRDYARLGLLLAHDGNWRGRQLIPVSDLGHGRRRAARCGTCPDCVRVWCRFARPRLAPQPAKAQ